MSLYNLPVSGTDLSTFISNIGGNESLGNPSGVATNINNGTGSVFSNMVGDSNEANFLSNGGWIESLGGGQIGGVNFTSSGDFGQVAVGTYGLMDGTPSATEEANLATTFLPGQFNNAETNGLNPVVYGAEAVGLAVATDNNFSNNFVTTYGGDTQAQFDSAVGTLLGINSNSIDTWVTNWTNSYTAHGIPGISNPTAQQIKDAAFGASFGDAVGTALVNPTANATVTSVDKHVINAVIDYGEGSVPTTFSSLMGLANHTALHGDPGGLV